jgi:putative ABC transport system permease protein
MSDAFFASGNAGQTLKALAARPDGILVAAETAKDFQLQPGDLLQLRLQGAQDQQYHLVPFHFLGIVREFPTAPKDSFLVANAQYVAQQTGSPAAEVVLLRTSGTPAAVAAQARPVAAGIGAAVTEIGSVRRTIGSSLTAVDLRGLTRLELSFAIVAAAAATGLVLALGLAERRRMFAILAALGARPGQLGAFIWSEGGLMLLSGALVGSVIGVVVAQVLVKLLTGVFDPPPATLGVPWLYLTVLGGAALVSTAAAILGAWLLAQRAAVAELHTL